ncbi:MAG: redoxin domain-containing protein [Clostridia bacterium]|nr:redoxin domain-containing protein [Clostridia bacterium]
MQAVITFLEGLITFISPCVLPMIPVYVLYFTGGEAQAKRGRTLLRALCFVAGFTALFVLLGVFAGSVGSLLIRYQRVVSLVTGAVIVFFGLHYAGVFRIALLERTLRPDVKIEAKGYASCALLGAVFAVGWSPCTGPFLGSAMMMAASEGQALSGMLLLLAYSLGLGVPFVLCALLIDRLKGAFAFIKRHYGVINKVCGVFLILVGVLMMSGWYARLSSMLPSFSLPYAQEETLPIPEVTQAPAAVVAQAATQEPVEAAPAATPVPQETAAPEAAEPAATEVPVGAIGPVFKNMAKDFTAYDDAGNPVSLKDFRGKPVVVNFFASWCGPCKMEMPDFEDCYKEYGDKVQFLMVNLCAFGNDTKEAGKALVAQGGYTFPVLFDTDGDAALTYSIRSMPTTIFVSADGELKGQRIGMIDRDTLYRTVQAMIAETYGE